MKKSRWFICFTNSSSSNRPRSVVIGRAAISLVLAVTVLGSLGLARCVYFGVSYGYAKLGMHYNLKQNRQLKQKLQFFHRFAQEEKGKISGFVAFEDKTRLKFGLEKISDDVRKAGVGGRPDNDEIAVASLGDPAVMKAYAIK